MTDCAQVKEEAWQDRLAIKESRIPQFAEIARKAK